MRVLISLLLLILSIFLSIVSPTRTFIYSFSRGTEAKGQGGKNGESVNKFVFFLIPKKFADQFGNQFVNPFNVLLSSNLSV